MKVKDFTSSRILELQFVLRSILVVYPSVQSILRRERCTKPLFSSYMSSVLIFIYDGQCPFCNKFAELLELKSGLPNLQIKNARERPPEIPSGYDMDLQGAILINGQKILYGAKAINWICSEITDPSDSLLKLLVTAFSSQKRSTFLFPFLLWARRLTLIFKGVPRKIDQAT